MRRGTRNVIALALGALAAAAGPAFTSIARAEQPAGTEPAPAPSSTSTGTCWGYGCGPQPSATVPPPEPTPPPPPTPPAPSPPIVSATPSSSTSPPDLGGGEDEPPDVTRPSTKLEIGGSLRRLFGFGVVGLDTRGGVGWRGRDVGHYFVGGFLWGETSEHLRTYSATVGYNLEVYLVDFLRLGFGVEGGLLWLRRASRDSRLFSQGLGAFVHAGADLVKLGHAYRAFYVDVRVQGALYIENAPFWGPTLSLGFRF